MEVNTAAGQRMSARFRVASLPVPTRWTLILFGSMSAWTLALTLLAREQFLRFDLQRYDLGNMVQAVWSTAHGRPLETTLGTGDQAVRLAAHADPILAVMAPLWLVFPSPLTLIVVQISACALGALPVYSLARRHLGSDELGALMGLAYLAYPWLAWSAMDAMHPVTLAIPLLLLCIWSLDRDRLWTFALSAMLVAATGELMVLTIAALGLWYWLAKGHRIEGIVISVTGLAWFAFYLEVVVPHFARSDSAFYSYYDHIGGSPGSVIVTAIADPLRLLHSVATDSDAFFVLAMTVPLLGLFLLAPGLTLVALPQIAANVLSSVEFLADPRGHHTAAVISCLFAATIYGIGRLPHGHRSALVLAVLGTCTAFSVLAGPWPGTPGRAAPWLESWPYGRPTEEHIAAVYEALALVPPGSPVASTNKVGSHLSARRYYFSVPVIRNARWVVIDTQDPWVPLPPRTPIRSTWGRHDPRLIAALIRRLEQSGEWTTAFKRDGVVVFRRGRARSAQDIER